MLLWKLTTACVFLSCCTSWKLTIVHTNDMHAWLDQGSSYGGICKRKDLCYGGFARVKFFTDWAKATYDNVLYLNAGDNFQGTTYYSLYKWKIIADFIDKMGIDVMSLGNHEFDDGLTGLVPYLKRIKTPWVCANIVTDHEPLFKDIIIKPWKIINVQGKLVAVIGYLTPETKYLGVVGNLTILDEVESLNQAVKEVKKLGADIVIALGHSGWERDIEIGQKVDGLDLIVGGHSHTFHYTGTPIEHEDKPVSNYPFMIIKSPKKSVPLVQASAYTKYVGFLNLTFDDNNNLLSAEGNPVLMDQVIPEDKMILKMLKPWRINSSHLMEEIIGVITYPLEFEDCRLRECNIGNLITDAMIDHRRLQYEKIGGKGWTDAPVAILNSGDIRASIRGENNGWITVGDLLTSIPFDGTLVKVTVNGSIFKDILEYSVHRYDSKGINEWGEFLQYSGVHVIFNMSRNSGDRVKYIEVRCGFCDIPKYQILTPESNITIITTGFVANGGDGFSLLTSFDKQNLGDTPYFDVIKNYIIRTSPIKSQVERRITILQ